jgi:hypothetical protein
VSEDYAYYLYARDLPALVQSVTLEEARLRRTHPLLADRLLKAFGDLVGELKVLAAQISGAGSLKLQEKERDTRVRPDTQGGGGPRLEDSLKADPILELPGSVGIADEQLLDRNVPWWTTNEEGSSARLGGRLMGLFYSSDFASGAAPDHSEFRVHPLFEAGSFPDGGMGVIQRPIPARRFIQKAIPDVEAAWIAGFERVKGKFNSELADITAQIGRELGATVV